MNISYLVTHLRARKIELWLEEEQLRFRGPKSELTSEMVSTLKAHKPGLIDYIKQFGQVRPVLELVAEVEPQDCYPLSSDQEPLWFLDQLRNGNPSDHLCRAFQFTNAVDYEILEAAFRQLIDRHEALRTIFRDSPEGARQFVLPEIDWSLARIDLSPHGPDAAIEETKRLCGELTRERFDLAYGPLLRCTLIDLGPANQVLLITMHHIIGDGHSLGVLTEELGEIYDSINEQRESWIPAPVRQYKDFANHRRLSTVPGASHGDEEYWRNRLDGFGQVLELPLDYPRPSSQSAAGARAFFEIEAGACERLREFARSEGVTLFMTVLAAFYVVLKRHTGQSDLVVGAPVSLRDRAEFETMIGMCLNMSVFAVEAEDELSFRDLLNRVRKTITEAFGHQQIPFQQLVNAVRSERDLSRNQIFQVLFQISSFGSLTIDGSEALPFDFDPGTSQFDMSVHLFEYKEGLRGFIEYDSDLFEAERISRMVEHLKTVVSTAVSEPDEPISRLPILPSSEQHAILDLWNRTNAEYHSGLCLHELFEEQVRCVPDKTAIVFESGSLTYQELNQRAERIASKLRSIGVGRESFVGINMSRSLEMVVAMFGILKSDAAYLPLDPSFPPDRLTYMVDDCGAKVVLTNLSTEEQVHANGSKVIDFATFESSKEEDTIGGGRLCNCRDLAYMIYTSGSTGRPKGVQIEHQAVVNFLTSMAREPGLSINDRLLAITTLSFDISVLEIFLPLCFGAELHLASDRLAKDAGRLLEYMATAKPTVMQATPTTWRMLLDTGWKGDEELVKLCGGEAMPPKLAKELSALNGSLWNMYGPTETTIWSSVRQIRASEDEVLIAGPIANTQFYVVDKNLQPVPIGVPGELLIGGDGLARGYWNRDELTNDRFIPNPFDSNSGSLLYRTGDLVRQNSSGEIQFISRLDFQVKLRGYRIELGEIERVLIASSSVKEAVVVTSMESESEKRLLAYFITNEDKSFDADEVRASMRLKLPNYMIPSMFIPLEKWPLTPNGKIDRKRLPSPTQLRQTSVEYVAAETEEQRILAGIWKSALKIEQVGIRDNFFDLGGDSLMALGITSRARAAGLSVTPSQIFDAPTIESLVNAATRVDSKKPLHERQVAPLVVPVTPFMSRFLNRRNNNDPNRWNLSVVFKGQRQLDTELIKRTFSILLDRHDALRLRVSNHETGWKARVEPEQNVDHCFSVHDLSDAPEDQRPSLLSQKFDDLQGSLDLANGPVARLAVIDLGYEEGKRVFFVAHHFAIDAIANTLFWEEFEAIYLQLESGKDVFAPAQGVGFAQWALDLARVSNSEFYRQQTNDWLTQPWQSLGRLPLDGPEIGDANNTNSSAATIAVSLDVSDTKKLLNAGLTGFTTETIIIAALSKSLSEFQYSPKVYFNRLIHGRDLAEVDVTASVGCYVNYSSTIIEVDVEEQPSQILQSTHEQLSVQVDIGNRVDLVRFLGSDDELSKQLDELPKADVLLNYVGKTEDVFANSSLFEVTNDSRGGHHDPDGQRDYALAILAEVVEDQFQARFVFSRNLQRQESVARLAERFVESVAELLEQPSVLRSVGS